MLTDQAVFDRLEHDVEFRSVATRLVQRYGYLLPSVNPLSEIAKQQDLVMKERAHMMAQRQDQEQAAALAAVEAEKKEERDEAKKAERTALRPRIQSICDEPASTQRRSAGSPPETSRFLIPFLPCCPTRCLPTTQLRMQRRASSDRSDSTGSPVWIRA